MKEGTKWRRTTTECRKFRKHSRARNVEVISQEELFIHLGNSRSLTELRSYQSLYDIGGYLKKTNEFRFLTKSVLVNEIQGVLAAHGFVTRGFAARGFSQGFKSLLLAVRSFQLAVC